MSTVDFNKRAELDITISLSGNGNFDPFGSRTAGLNWTLSGTVTAKTDPETDLTVAELLRCKPIPPDAVWTEFGAPPSVGNQSSFVNVGTRPTPILFESPLGQEIGPWTVNEKPILTDNGNVDGELSKKGYYVVQVAKDKTEDDFIELDPPIDGLAKVYPGDLIYSVGDDVYRQWRRQPRERWPRPDRTFFWQPNVNPFVEEDGKIDGEMAKPGTIILPTQTLDFTDPTKPFLFRYAYAGYGWMFNGYEWKQLTLRPYKYQPPKENPEDPDPAPEYRDLFVTYYRTERFAGCLEETQRQKPFIYTSKAIDDSSSIALIITPDPVEGQPPPEPEIFNLQFRWLTPGAVENGIQPTVIGSPFYDFADTWTNYHKANVQWCKDRNIGQFIGAGFTLKTEGDEPQTIFLNVDCFEDGNVTTIKEELKIEGGETYVNTYTITLSVQMAMT